VGGRWACAAPTWSGVSRAPTMAGHIPTGNGASSRRARDFGKARFANIADWSIVGHPVSRVENGCPEVSLPDSGQGVNSLTDSVNGSAICLALSLILHTTALVV